MQQQVFGIWELKNDLVWVLTWNQILQQTENYQQANKTRRKKKKKMESFFEPCVHLILIISYFVCCHKEKTNSMFEFAGKKKAHLVHAICLNPKFATIPLSKGSPKKKKKKTNKSCWYRKLAPKLDVHSCFFFFFFFFFLNHPRCFHSRFTYLDKYSFFVTSSF